MREPDPSVSEVRGPDRAFLYAGPPPRPGGLSWVLLARMVRSTMGLFGLGVLVSLVLIAAFAPALAPFDPAAQHEGSELQPPGSNFLFGSDEFGRDILSRVVFGSRISLVVGLVAVSLGATAGVPLRMVAGFYGGWPDVVIMRCSDALLALPGILLAIAILAVLGSGTMQTALALAIVSMPEFARLMRSSVLVEREREYVLAGVSIGSDNARLIIRHVLPNALSPIIVQLSLAMSFAVLAEAALSFLGMGTRPPTPSWGGMLQESRQYLRQAPWFGVFPGLALAILLLGLNYLSDAMRDALDPRSQSA
jgi:peptide/nickel transport system permease protein